MLAHVYLLALLGFCTPLEIEKALSSRYKIDSSINDTIKDVEKFTQDNPRLSRLRQTDIANILYNITSKDMSFIEDKTLDPFKKIRANYQRALMVVFPHKLQNSENLKDLFIKPPMVQILSDEEFNLKKNSEMKKESIYNSNLYLINNTQQTENYKKNKHHLITAYTRDENSKKLKIPTNINFEELEATTIKVNIGSQKFNFDLDFDDQEAEASYTSIATKRPLYKGTFSRYRTSTQTPIKSEIDYTSTITKTPISIGIKKKITQNESTENVLSSNQWQNNSLSTTTTSRQISVTDKISQKRITPSNNHFFTSTISSFINSTMTVSITPKPIFVTPSITTNREKIQSHVNTVPSSVKIISTLNSVPIREQVELLLKSIGLQSIKSNNQQNNIQSFKNSINTQVNSHFNDKFKNSKIESTTSNLLNILKNNSFQIPSLINKDDIKNLSSNIQLLFQQFGLQMPVQKEISTITTFKPLTTVNINSFTHFKPLPTSSVKDKEFRNFLAKFGLGLGENRSDKAMQYNTTIKRPSIIEVVPDNMKRILENIGLLKKTQKIDSKLKQDTTQMNTLKIMEQTTLSSEHVFKPYENIVEDKEQNKKIKNLISTVRMIQEGKANFQDVQDIANDLLKNTKSLESGPDPVKLEEIFNNYRNNFKNEVKRHQKQPPKMTTSTNIAMSTTKDLDETTLSFMATNDTSGSFSKLISTSTKDEFKQPKINHSYSLSTNANKTKPSFFDTFDISEYLNKTDSVNSSSTTTALPSSSISSINPGFFETFNINDHINKTIDEDSVKNNNVSLSDLEASFGGSTSEPDLMIPTRPKTGLYFLVDWNTFLEVGEEGKEKVNLRFSPKVGDKTRFISVKMS